MLLGMSGCVSIDQYPAEWGSLRLSADSACPDVSGRFRDQGERANSNFKPSLSYQLLRSYSQKAAETVEIKFVDPTVLHIRVFNGAELIAESVLSSNKGEFQCANGFVVIKKGEFINREGVFGGEKWTFSLAPSGNALVVKENDSAIGTMLLFPVAGTSTSWSRFPRTD